MEDARRWGSIDSFVEWLRFRAPEEAFMAGSDGELAARFYGRLAEWLFALALLGFWRLNCRDECAACASALDRVAPEHDLEGFARACQERGRGRAAAGRRTRQLVT